MPLKKFIKARWFAGALSCVMLLSLLAGCKAKAPEEEDFSLTVNTTAPAETEGPKEMSVTDLLKAVTTLKDDLETVLDGIKENELDSAKEKIVYLPEKTETIRSSLTVTLNNLGDSTPSLQKELINIQNLLDLTDQMNETILTPTVAMMEQYASEQKRQGENLRVKFICDYLDFAETLLPDVEKLMEAAENVDFSLVDSDGDIERYLKTAEELLVSYHENPEILSAVKTIFGDGEDRTYLVAAQCSAETRASGGFPGAMGIITIENGTMEMDDFKKVYNILSGYTPAEAKITAVENHIFQDRLQYPRDADFCPDYERVAYIWSLGYRAAQGEEVDGVISMTPTFLQRMLAAMDEEVKLFDGTVINGDNAVRVLQRDMYMNYMGPGYTKADSMLVDQLFSDAAMKTMQKFMDNMEVSDLTAYLSVVKECIADRTLLLWMADEEEQSVIHKLGWHGGLNEDPENPQAGVYYNVAYASKMGWFLNMDTQMGERVQNADGSYTYPVTVTFSNVMTEEERRQASNYIMGVHGGAIYGCAYFFAPAGGTVSDFKASNGLNITLHEYHGLQLGYMNSFNTYAGTPVTVTYNVTTAPGVETPLEFSKTPTTQAYH